MFKFTENHHSQQSMTTGVKHRCDDLRQPDWNVVEMVAFCGLERDAKNNSRTSKEKDLNNLLKDEELKSCQRLWFCCLIQIQ